MTARPLAAVLFGAVMAASIAAAQAPMPPPSPPPPPPIGGSYTCNGRPDPTGNSTLRGTILSLDTGAPVREAQVQLGGAGLCNARTATDAYGRYELANLPAGRIYVSVAKAGYVTTSYGQRRPFEARRSIDLFPAQTVDDIDVALPRAGVIVARVTDEFGEPMSGVRVQAERVQFDNGRRMSVSEVHMDTPLTDDRGELRLYGLPPGEYYVNAMGSNPAPIPLPIGAVDRERVYVPTYFPGTSDVAGAQRVVVQAGGEQTVTFPLTVGRLAHISGIVRNSSGTFPNAQVMVASPASGITFSRRASAQPNGVFSLPDVLPGSYVLAAVARASGSGEVAEIAAVPLTVSGDDVSGVALTLQRTGTLRGKIVYDTPPPAGFSPGSLRLSFSTVSSAEITVPVNVASPTSNWLADSTFAFTGLMNRMLPRLTAGSGWFLKAVRIDGRDVTDIPFDFTSGADFNDVEMIVTRLSSQISGIAQDNGAPVGDYTALVFPENRDLWVWPSRFISTARADQRGRFTMPGLPAGQYLIVALDYLEQGREFDPELLGRLREHATSITLGEGEKKEMALTLIKN